MSQMAENATRETRAETTRRERRMKPGDNVNPSIKLGLDESKLDRATKVYRWVNDKPGRVRELQAKDWDLVDNAEAKPDGAQLGSIPAVHGGIGENGAPYGMVLMSKFKDWHDEDERRKRKPLAEMDKAIQGGTAHDKAGEADLGGSAYTPGTNSIEVRNSR
jgi:hypothetical protein